MVIHNFVTSNSKGKLGETLIKEYLQAKGWEVTDATRQQQLKKGIDFTVRKDGKSFALEVKTEYRAESTGNVFWEMEVDGKPGWTQKYKEGSQVLICTLLPIKRIVYMYFSKSLPRITSYVEDNFQSTKKIITNQKGRSDKTYLSWGYLLPLEHLSKFAKMYTL
jgi:hypothetical protein